MDKLEMWFERIKNYPQLKLDEAQKLYTEMIKENDNDKKINIRNNLINSTLYVVLNYLKNSDLDILENGSYDMDDIVSSTIEYYINEIDNVLKKLREKKIPDECDECEHSETCHGGLKCLTYAIFKDLNHKDIGCNL